MYIDNHPSNFTQSEIDDAVRIWNSAAISLLDIRHNLISVDQSVRSYHLPASAFVFTSGGGAEVLLNDTAYNVERFGLFHGGKGTELTITPRCEWLETYMVLYKAGEPPFHRKDYIKLMEQTNPFRQQYGFAPTNPLFFADRLSKMYERWRGPTPLNLFYGKTAFYSLLYERYEQLEAGDVGIFEPDIVAMAKRYLDKHYDSEIVIQDMCNTLGVSYSYFYKSFKERQGDTPQEYLIQTRLSAAKHWLRYSDMPMRVIAESAGFANERNFYRTFAKHFNMSPNSFRKNASLQQQDYDIGKVRNFPYNEQGRVNRDQLREKGANTMFKQMGNKAVVAAALSLVLLLSACSATPVKTNVAQPTPTPAVTTQAPQETKEAEPVEQTTRIVSTVMGDVEVPANPKRVIATYGIGDVIALGVIPIATYDVTGTAFESEVAGLPVWSEFEAEEIMAYDPDLILVANKDQYDEVSKIAPTVFVPFTELSMEERVTFLGEVLNKEDEADKAISAFETKVENAKKALETAGIGVQTFSIFEYSANGGVWVYGDKWGRGGDLLYSHLGLTSPPVIQDEIIGKDQYRDISMEVIGDYAGDYIIFSGELGDLKDNAVWNALPAVKNGKLIPIDYDLFYNIDIYSSGVQLDYIMSQLVKE